MFGIKRRSVLNIVRHLKHVRQLERSACRVVLGTNEHSTRLNVRLSKGCTRPALHSAYPFTRHPRLTRQTLHTASLSLGMLLIWHTSSTRHVFHSAFLHGKGVSFHSASQHRSARFLHSTERPIDLERKARHAERSACFTRHAERPASLRSA